MVAHENYEMSAPGKARILACVINYSKKVAVSKSREITRVAYLGQITNIRSGRAQNYKRSSPGRAGILAGTISYSKKVAISELLEITWVAYLGQITNIGSGRARKL